MLNLTLYGFGLVIGKYPLMIFGYKGVGGIFL